MEPLDLSRIPLQGINLIEASAGTGKTYTITGLYLRLLLEGRLTVDRILVVTYTKAATAELRDRIRTVLGAARSAFIEGGAEDESLKSLLTRCQDQADAIRRLEQALHGFDEAAVFTIHGFCQRVLTDNAFESATPFAAEVVSDETEMVQEVVDDFWRKWTYQESPLWVEYLVDAKQGPQQLYRVVSPYVGKPYLCVGGPDKIPELQGLEAALQAEFERARSIWRTDAEEIKECLLNSTTLNGTKYRKDRLEGWLSELTAYLQAPALQMGLLPKAEKFAQSAIDEGTKKGCKSPRHPFFERWGAFLSAHRNLVGAYEQRWTALQRTLLKEVEEQLRSRKARHQIWSYNDLLIGLSYALTGEGGAALVQALRDRYQAAMIDEFQDTDPLQYQIFTRIYSHSRCPLFLVGDPKQAIYSFRGADVFTYLRGRQAAARAYTLDVNWRSTPPLIRAVNTLFADASNPFVISDIEYHAVRPAEIERERLVVQDEEGEPLRIWCVEGDEQGRALNKGDAQRRCAQATASEIGFLLTKSARGLVRIGDREIEGSDIAVLVRTHRLGSLVRDALLELGIPSVQHSPESVFHSHEALEIERVLLAIAAPEDDRLVRAALCTDLMGMSAYDLVRFDQDDQAWDTRLSAFYTWHQVWREHGFIHMFRAFSEHEGVLPRLRALPEGERRATNTMHVAELLQGAAQRLRLGLEALIKWLATRRQAERIEGEEQQLRLESDEHLVKIVTIHKSKGLQYPIVFCPFLWDGGGGPRRSGPLMFHDPAQDSRLCLQFDGGDMVAQRLVQSEEFAEDMRLLYVALTRAQYRCHVAWGNIRGAERSALAWVLHPPECDEAADLQRHGETVKSVLGTDGRWADLEALAQRSQGAIRVEPFPSRELRYAMPSSTETKVLKAREFGAEARRAWRITSYSDLVGGHAFEESPDYDADAGASSEPREVHQPDIFSFPRGTLPGQCLHAIFERFDFTEGDPTALARLVSITLRDFGFDQLWAPVIGRMVRHVLDTTLDGNLRLRDIASEARLTELEFYYPVTMLDPQGLKKILVGHGQELPGSADGSLFEFSFASVSGYLKGYIDLVFQDNDQFYVVDYKSNWLGDYREDYSQARLERVMARKGYVLQYLLYTLAVHRYLRHRQPDYEYGRHFGGVFYLFLRGIDPSLGREYGVFRHRPSEALIHALDDYIS